MSSEMTLEVRVALFKKYNYETQANVTYQVHFPRPGELEDLTKAAISVGPRIDKLIEVVVPEVRSLLVAHDLEGKEE